jgi:hypothetical protein
VHQFGVLGSEHHRESPAKGVADKHERLVGNLAQGGKHKIRVVASPTGRFGHGRCPKAGQIERDRANPAFSQGIRRKREVLGAARPAVEPDDTDLARTIGFPKKSRVTVASKHNKEVIDDGLFARFYVTGPQ